jgi:acetoin utilization protein AcuB
MTALCTDGRDAAGTEATVADHMTRRVLAVRDDCSPGIAMDTVLASGHRHVVVVDSSGTFMGVLAAEAITHAWMTRLAHRRQLVRDLLTTPPVHLSPGESMHTAASVMLSHSVDAVGVVEPEGRLVGILTWADIVAMVAERGRA